MLLNRVKAVGGQTSVLCKITKGIDRWQTQFGSERNDQILVDRIERAWGHNEPAIWSLGERSQRSFDLCRTAQANRCHSYPKGGGSCFRRAHEFEVGGDVWTVNECHAAHARRDFLEHLQPFSADGGFEVLEARDVSTRARQVCNEAAPHRVGNDNEHNRDRLSRISHDCGSRIGPDNNDVWRQCDQLVSASAHALGHLARETKVKSNVAAFVPAKFVKTLPESGEIRFHYGFTVIGKGY